MLGLLLIIILISSIPVIAVYVWFRLAKYQFSLVRFLLALLAGAAAFFPALVLQNLLNLQIASGGRAELFYYFFIRIAFTEEISRMLILIVFFLISGLQRQQHNEKTGSSISWHDIKKGAATGLVAGLGFAILESATYAASGMAISVLLLRTVTAAPLHAACASRIGSAAATIRTNPVHSLFRLLTATVIHGIYNLMVTIPGILPSIAAVLIAITALASSILTIRGGWQDDNPTS